MAIFVGTCLGCRKAEEAMMERSIESQMAEAGGNADVHIGDDSVSFKIQDEKGNANVEIGQNTKLPEGFPQDVPLYPKMTLMMANAQTENERFFLVGTSSDAPEQIATYYKQAAAKNGWEEQNSMEQEDQMRGLTFQKAGRNLEIIAVVTDEGTSLNISTGKDN
ncbi:MAG: hypothetical protein ACYC0X_12700 [Pirellulaceae bacterium]